jgi:hypothetical protein
MKWFKHDSRANRDAKIEKLMLKYGADGYALYWLCLELIADGIDREHITFELEHDAEILGARLKIDRIRVEEIMGWMVQAELFEQSEGRITCLKLSERLENSLVKSPELNAVKDKIRENPGKSGKSQENSGQNRIDIDKNRYRRDNKDIEPATLVFYSPETETAWKRWREYKKTQFKFTYKSTDSEQSAINHMEKLANNIPGSATALVDYAISQGWKGLYEPKAPPGNRPVLKSKSEQFEADYQRTLSKLGSNALPGGPDAGY